MSAIRLDWTCESGFERPWNRARESIFLRSPSLQVAGASRVTADQLLTALFNAGIAVSVGPLSCHWA